MRIKETKVYHLAELSETAKEKAVENLYDINIDSDFWFDGIYEDAKTIGALMGIDITNIYFSGFSSQGDGACFEGSYEYKKGGIKAIKEHAPKETELHQIVRELQMIQRKNFYKLSASIRQSGHYNHERCTAIEVYHKDYAWSLSSEDADNLAETLRSFMQWIYSQLHKQYDWSTTEEAIVETIEANEYEFTENGKLA